MINNFTPGHTPEENENIHLNRYMHTMLTAAPAQITKMWKQPKCLPTGKWTKKPWHMDRYIHTHSGKPPRHSKRTKCCHLQQHGWAQRVSGLVKRSKANTLYYHFYVESKNFIPLCPPFPFGNQSLNVFLFF